MSNNLTLSCVSKVQVLHAVIEDRNKLDTIKIRNANWIGHILRRKATTGNIEYWRPKEEALDRSLWRTGFRRGYGPVIRETSE
jgi:hypothetical protein